jgi:predicted permease
MGELHFGRRLRQFFWKPDPAAEIREEVSHHVELIVRELVTRGMSRAEAEAEATRRFGASAAVEDRCSRIAEQRNRQRYWAGGLADIRDDLRFAFRNLRNHPGYSVTAGLTLAVAIAANALVFTLVNSVLLRQLPYDRAEQLVVLEELTGQGGEPWELSAPVLADIRASATRFASITGWLTAEVTVRGDEMERVTAALVDSAFFPTVGTAPQLGQPNLEENTVVLSHQLWMGRFGGDSAVIGQTIGLNDGVATVVGVMPEGFALPSQETQLWLSLGPPQEWMLNRAVHIFRPVARVKPGSTVEAVRTELAEITRRLQQDHGPDDPGHALSMRPLHTVVTGDVRTTLLVILGAVLVMLLLAGANLAGLTITRVRTRDGEFAIRAALGASRGRLIRQLLIEGLLLATLGAGVGLLMARLGLRQAVRLLPPSLPRLQEIHLDGRVILFTLGMTAGCGLLLGLLPAWHAGRLDLRSRLTSTGKGAIAGGNQLTQGGLVVLQIALCLVLIIGAALLVRSFERLQSVEPGFSEQGVATVQLSTPTAYQRPQVISFYQELPQRLAAIPGVTAVSATSALPISGGDGVGGLTIEGRELPEGDEASASYRRVLPGYFATMRIPLVRGRDFTLEDRGSPEMVVIISSAMALRFWPNEDPVGHRIKLGPPEDEPWLTIVGVVGDVHNVALDLAPRYDTYEPHAQRPRGTMSVVLRTQGDPAQAAVAVRELLRAGETDLSVWDLNSMQARIEQSLAPRRFNAGVITGFGVVALGLALLGVYGITANAVSRRKKEFGVRLALGAAPSSIRSLVVRQGLALAGLGVVIGLPAAWWLSTSLHDLLFNVTPTDPVAYSVAAIVLAGTALLASLVPAHRASRVSPMTTLREE